MRRGIGTVAMAPVRADRGLGAAPFRRRDVVPPPERQRDGVTDPDPWGAEEPGVSPRVAGLACGIAVLVVALAGWMAG